MFDLDEVVEQALDPAPAVGKRKRLRRIHVFGVLNKPGHLDRELVLLRQPLEKVIDARGLRAHLHNFVKSKSHFIIFCFSVRVKELLFS